MNSRQTVLSAVNHKPADRVPLDLGAAPTTGIAATALYRLKRSLGLIGEGEPVKIVEPFQMLGEVDAPLREALGVDVVGLPPRTNFFGFANDNYKPWRLFDGTPVLVPGQFNTDPDANGDILQYPGGDRSQPPSARMPQGGFYFDAIIRQRPIDDSKLSVEDNLQEFQPLGAADLDYYSRESTRLRSETDCAVMILGPGTALGDVALVPAPWMADPRGIRDVEEWYVSLMIRKDYVAEVYSQQTEIALANLARLWAAVGDNADIIYMSGTDFGTQCAPFLSPQSYRELYLPHHKRMNDWVHANTSWKTFMHSCGSIEPLIDHFIEAGFDILNPVQASAAGMELPGLKSRYGQRITFWGGGADTQQVLPRASADEVRAQVRQRLKILAPGGGFVFNPVHNIQADVPPENLLAMYDEVRKFRL